MSEQVNAPRHKPGRGSQVSDAERNEIVEAYVLERQSVSALARRFGRGRETIAGIVHSPACEAAKASLMDVAADRAREVLRLATTTAAQSWVTSLEKAAARGNHQAARDLLLHTKTIDPVTPTGGAAVQVLIGVAGLPGLPGYDPAGTAKPIQWPPVPALTVESRAQSGHTGTETGDE